MKRIVTLVLVIVLLAVCRVGANAQWTAMTEDVDNLLHKGVDYIYNIEFDSAHACFVQVVNKYPDHPAGYFMDAMIDWWKLLIDKQSHAFDDSFLAKTEKVITVCDAELAKDPNNVGALFFKGGILGYRGRYHATRGNYFRAASDGIEALGILDKCQKLAPGNHDIMLGTGTYNYLAVAVPEKNPALSTITGLFPKGDKHIGMLQLKAAAEKARYANVEATYLVIQAYVDFEYNYTSALPYASYLSSKYPRNSVFQRYYGRCLAVLGPNTKADSLWRDVITKYLDRVFGYDKLAAREAMYYIGSIAMVNGQFDRALIYFYKTDEASRALDEDPSGFMVKTNLKIGQIYDLQGKRSLAIKQYDKVLAWKDTQNSHAEANKYKISPYK